MATKEQIGRRIRSAREEGGLTQAELGDRLGVSHSVISDLERGIPKKVDLFDLEKIGEILGKPLSYFLGQDTEEDRKAAEYKRLATELERLRGQVRGLEPDYMRDMIPIPLIGTVPGGYPDFRAEEDAEEFYPIRRVVIHEEDAYCLKVTGNSMIGRGIFDGDIVFVDAVLKPKDGSIVIARKGDEAVIRVYREDDNGPYLEAANKGYKRLRLKEAEIIGVVVESRREHRT